jgi:hypothetical protein
MSIATSLRPDATSVSAKDDVWLLGVEWPRSESVKGEIFGIISW